MIEMNTEKLLRIDIFEEAIGVVKEISHVGGMLAIKIGNVLIALPISMENEMQSYLGRRIALIHTDIPGKEYLVRIKEPTV